MQLMQSRLTKLSGLAAADCAKVSVAVASACGRMMKVGNGGGGVMMHAVTPNPCSNLFVTRVSKSFPAPLSYPLRKQIVVVPSFQLS